MDKEMIERCCLAACEELGSKYTKDDKCGDYTVVEDRTICITDAVKAIIFAMREPTIEMLDAGHRAARAVRISGVSGMTLEAQTLVQCARESAAWQAMIDSILND